MNGKFKHGIAGYFNFFYRSMGIGLILNMILSFLVSFLDGIGLAMFIPLLQFIDTKATDAKKGLSGSMQYMIDFFDFVHLPLNIYTILLLMILLFAIKGVFNFFVNYSQVNLKRKFMQKLRYGLNRDLQEMTYEGFTKLDSGRVQNILTAEASKLLVAMGMFLASAKSVIMVLTYIILAFMADWKFAVLVAIGSVIMNLLFKNVFSKVKGFSGNISSKGNQYYSFLGQAVHYFKYLKATGHFPYYSKKINKVIDEIEELNRKIGFSQSLSSSIREPLVILIVALVIIIQIRWMGSSIGSIILSILLLYRGLSYLMGLQTSWQFFMQNVGSIEATDTLSKELNANKETMPQKSFVGFNKGIFLQGLSFSYGEKKVLNNINIEIHKNSTIALVGESGSGKTTLANVITGLIQPLSGSLLIDDTPLNVYNLIEYRKKIGYISQEAVIFKDNVFNNVTFWADSTPDNIKRFWEVVELTSLTGFINNLPEKEQTELGDNGILISGGQKQRISIARELFKEVDIMILDEATSALDSETELFIQENIERLQGNYTMIIIAHRLSTIKNVDQIYLLDNGEVTGHGTFDELTLSSNRFGKMVSLQKV